LALEYSFLENGWVVRIHNRIQDMSLEDKLEALELLRKNVVVVWKNQKLTPREELDFCGSFGSYDFADVAEYWDNLPSDQQDIFIKEYPGILRVTAKPGTNGGPGHFSHKTELKWHSDRIGHPDRRPCVWLYGITDTTGSVTNFTNNFLAYNALSEEEKNFYGGLRVSHYNTRYQQDSDRSTHAWRIEENLIIKNMGIWDNIIVENDFGDKSFFFSPLQVGCIEGMSEEKSLEIADELLQYLTQPQFVYSHQWEDGDVVISEQTFSMHSRDAFNDMEKRYLHHIQFNVEKILPDLKYPGYNDRGHLV
jgi:alpha-ketoglutarate-dependent taurine dioxygenase